MQRLNYERFKTMELRLMFGVNMIPGVIWVLGMFLCYDKGIVTQFYWWGIPENESIKRKLRISQIVYVSDIKNSNKSCSLAYC